MNESTPKDAPGRPDRRSLVKTAAAIGGAMAFPFIARAQVREIVIGGAAPDAVWMNEWFAPMILKKHNVKILFEGAIATINLEKLRAGKAKPALSLIFMDESTMMLAMKDDLLDPMPIQAVPNMAAVRDGVIRHNGTWVQFLRHWTGIAVNTKSPVPSGLAWSDLWNPKYKARVAIPSLKNTDGVHVFQMAAALKSGKSPDVALRDSEAAFAKLAELKSNLLTIYTNAPQAMNLLEQGDAQLFVSFSSLILGRKRGGGPVDLVAPKEGVMTVPQTLGVVKGGPAKDLATTLVNEFLSAEVQSYLSNRGGSLSVRSDVAAPSVLPADTKVFGTDWDYVAVERPKLLERYERDMQI